MDKTNLSPIDRWWEEYKENPVDALHDLLCGTAFTGRFSADESDDILFRLFHAKSKKARLQLDNSMKLWLETWWGRSPGNMVPSRWSYILQNSFIAIYRLTMMESVRYLKRIYLEDTSWIRSLYHNSSRDPEDELLRTLALCQEDQSLLPLWMRLCRWEEDVPIDYAGLGLMGLLKLPEKSGEPPRDIPKAFFKGAITLAEVLAEKNVPKSKDYWLMEMRAITAMYPRSKRYWQDRFSPLLFNRTDSPPAQWLDKVIPKLSQKRFFEVMAKIPDIDPEECDKL